jgi:hypothetical protein
MVETGLSEGVLVGVAVAVETLALMLLLPGAVIDSLPDAAPNRLGVAGSGWKVPSLVLGLLPLLDIADAGRDGGGMLLSTPKKLDLRRPLPAAGEDVSAAMLSTVLSESEGRDFFFVAFSGSSSSSMAWSGSGSGWGSGSWSRNPALDPAREEALEAERKPSKLPSASSSCGFGTAGRGGGFEAWRDGGRA